MVWQSKGEEVSAPDCVGWPVLEIPAARWLKINNAGVCIHSKVMSLHVINSTKKRHRQAFPDIKGLPARHPVRPGRLLPVPPASCWKEVVSRTLGVDKPCFV